MLKKIKLNYGFLGWHETWAWVDGVFAIHKHESSEGWALTHVPSGMGVLRNRFDKTGCEKKVVIKRLKEAKNFRWRGVNPFEKYAPCELLNLAPIIYKEKKYDDLDIQDWIDNQQQQSAEALRCLRQQAPTLAGEAE